MAKVTNPLTQTKMGSKTKPKPPVKTKVKPTQHQIVKRAVKLKNDTNYRNIARAAVAKKAGKPVSQVAVPKDYVNIAKKAITIAKDKKKNMAAHYGITITPKAKPKRSSDAAVVKKAIYDRRMKNIATAAIKKAGGNGYLVPKNYEAIAKAAIKKAKAAKAAGKKTARERGRGY